MFHAFISSAAAHVVMAVLHCTALMSGERHCRISQTVGSKKQDCGYYHSMLKLLLIGT